MEIYLGLFFYFVTVLNGNISPCLWFGKEEHFVITSNLNVWNGSTKSMKWVVLAPQISPEVDSNLAGIGYEKTMKSESKEGTKGK